MYYASKQRNTIIDSKSSRVFSGTKLARFENGIKFLLRNFFIKSNDLFNSVNEPSATCDLLIHFHLSAS